MKTIAKANAYVLRIRNQRKREYAAAYLGYRAGLLGHSPQPPKDIAYMAAQGVRLQLDKILSDE